MIVFPIAIMAIADNSDREFMELLYLNSHMMMYRMAYSLCHSAEEADDIVSDAVVLLIRKVSVIKAFECSVLEGYIISVVKYAAYHYWRKKKQRGEVALSDEILSAHPGEDRPPDEALLKACTMQELMACIHTLKKEEQVLIQMRYFDDLPNYEIAEVLNLNESTVRAKLTRIRQKLFALLSEVDHDETRD